MHSRGAEKVQGAKFGIKRLESFDRLTYIWEKHGDYTMGISVAAKMNYMAGAVPS